MAAKKKVGARPGPRGRAPERKGTRQDPILLSNRVDWSAVKNKDPRFDYHFWPEGMGPSTLGYALEMAWEPVLQGDAESLFGGSRTVKTGEPIRGVHGQVLCRRPKEYGERERGYKRDMWASMAHRMGHETPGAATRASGETVERPQDDQYVQSQGVELRGELGEGPYPAYQESAQ